MQNQKKPLRKISKRHQYNPYLYANSQFAHPTVKRTDTFDLELNVKESSVHSDVKSISGDDSQESVSQVQIQIEEEPGII